MILPYRQYIIFSSFSIVLLCVWVNLVHAAPAPFSRTARDGCLDKLRVHLTVSPLVNESVRQIELHWTGPSPQPGDWIGIFESEPEGAVPLPPELVHVDTEGNCSGWQRTELTDVYRPNSSEQLGYVPRCLGYYIGYIRGPDNTVLTRNCLRLEPTWMTERPLLGNFALSQIFIPGSHDTGAWGEYKSNIRETRIVKYSVTQDEDLLSQLIRGVRYLDIRVAYYKRHLDPSLSGFWLNHGVLRMRPLEEVTAQVRMFLENTPDTELIIFDVEEFPLGFDSMEIHEKLLAFLQKEFSDFIIPQNETSLEWMTPIQELWGTEKRIVIGYDESSVVEAHPWLWRNVNQMWGNVRTLDHLYMYLEAVMENPPKFRAWSAMAELTPNAYDVISDKPKGLRTMADVVNRNVTEWFQGDWGSTVNIVSVDFFRGTDIVQTALEWNDRRINAWKLSKPMY